MSFNLSAAKTYLLNQYDPAVGLFHEAPNSAPTSYWYHNDLFVAQLALGGMPTGALDVAWPSLPPPRVRVLSGDVFKDNTVFVPNYTIILSTKGSIPVIKTESPNLSANPLAVTQFADIAFYNVIHLFNQGQYNAARAALIAVEQMWDGIGWNDVGKGTGPYETYKCALYVIACKRLGLSRPLSAPNQAVLVRCQVFDRPGFANQQGGISTNYTATDPYAGDTNIETTSDCVVASS
jgi:hypothetical protein